MEHRLVVSPSGATEPSNGRRGAVPARNEARAVRMRAECSATGSGVAIHSVPLEITNDREHQAA